MPSVNFAVGWGSRHGRTCCCIQMSGWILKLEKEIHMQPKKQPNQSHTVWSPKVIFLLQHYLFLANIAEALVCLVGSWQKWWLPWMLFWVGLDTRATHTAASAHYTWKHPRLWAQHTHWHHESKLSLWTVLTAAIQPALGSPPPDLSCSIIGLACRDKHTHTCMRAHTHTHMATVNKQTWWVFKTRLELAGEGWGGYKQQTNTDTDKRLVRVKDNSGLLRPECYFHGFWPWYLLFNITR